MSDRNPIDPVLSLSDIIPGSFKPFFPKFEGNPDLEEVHIDPKSLGLIEEQAGLEALAYKKYLVYSEYFKDPQLKKITAEAARLHKRHFEVLQDCLGNRF